MAAAQEILDVRRHLVEAALARLAGSPVKTLEGDSAWIEENHEDICKGNRAVANKIDELTAVYLTTIYKLRNLK